jgi:hypothetical protein
MSAIPWVGQDITIIILTQILFIYTLKMANTKIEPHKVNKKGYNTLNWTKNKNLKPMFIRNYSTVNGNSTVDNNSTVNSHSKLDKLNPDFVSGFIDAEGSFTTVVYYKNRWCINSVFKITLHKKDLHLLKSLQAYFGGVGRISGSDVVSYRVENISSLINSIITHLDKYPLQTQKKADYELFKRIVILMDKKQHLTPEGLQEIINIKGGLNKGVSEELLAEFPNTTPVSRPLVELPEILERPHWLAGFTAGDGCFFVYVEKNAKYSSGFRSKLRFNICQHLKDKLLMERIASYFNCGIVTEASRGEVNFDVHKFSDIYDNIIPFFDKYAIHGVKAKDFEDWKSVAELMKTKDHLTKKGLEKITIIKSNMNKSRIIS